MNEYFIFAIGLFAQLLFGARQLIQWLKSEKEKQVISPIIFWQLSLVASLVFMIYGLLREDPVIVIGQIIAYFIYMRNLQLQNSWNLYPRLVRWVFLFMPLLMMSFLAYSSHYDLKFQIFSQSIPLLLLLLGFTGQLAMNLRFVYQWYQSEKVKKSELTVGFWKISIFGASVILVYAIFRQDPVLIIGSLCGLVVYFRNVKIHYDSKRVMKLQ